MLRLLIFTSYYMFLINFPFSTCWYAHLSSPNVIPVSLENVVTRSNCFFVMLMFLTYNFRSSTKKLCVISLVLSIPYEYPLMFLIIKYNGLTVNMNNKTDWLSPWNICFRNLMASDVIVSFSPFRWSVAHHWVVRCSMALINCFNNLISSKAYSSHSCGTESNAFL